MNKLSLLFILLLSAKGLSQDKGYIAVTLGPSFPVGNFADTDVDNDAAGLAQGGAIFDVTFTYKLAKKLGVVAILRGQANNVDNAVIENELFTQTGRTWTADTEGWTTGALLVGGYASLPISRKIAFEPKAMIGFAGVTSPELNITLDGSGGAGWVKQDSEMAESFSYLVGAGFKFDVGRKICLLVNVDYFATKPKFKDIQITSSEGGAPERISFTQNMAAINLGFGIGYRL
jgi:hypothetical protein